MATHPPEPHIGVCRYLCALITPLCPKDGMSIKEESKSANGKSLKGEYPERYVVAETAIREFVESLRIFDIEEAAARLQAVADATSRLLENPIDQPNAADLRLILRIATESKNRRYQQIMRAIIAGVSQGPDGIKAAHLTASRSVELAFRWTREYVLTFREFRERLRATDSAQSTTQKPLRRLAAGSK